MKENKLIREIQNGNEQAIDDLISQLYPQIYSYVYVRMKGRDCSKDITQEVFLNFIKNIDHFEFRGKTKQYLLRIAVNCCNGWYRNDLETYHLEDTETIAAKEENIQQGNLRALLQKLPAEQEEALVLRYYEELKIKEIAMVLDLSENTVKTRLRLGLSKLKQMIRKEDWL